MVMAPRTGKLISGLAFRVIFRNSLCGFLFEGTSESLLHPMAWSPSSFLQQALFEHVPTTTRAEEKYLETFLLQPTPPLFQRQFHKTSQELCEHIAPIRKVKSLARRSTTTWRLLGANFKKCPTTWRPL